MDDLGVKVIHAVAVFENLSEIGISQDDISSLTKFICSEQHLMENISKIELDVGSN